MNRERRLIIGCDHGAFQLKEILKGYLTDLGVVVEDAGTKDQASVSYVDYAAKVAGAVSKGRFTRGILLCGTGLGMSMAANRFPNVRAALCNDLFSARLSREHNDANILVLGGRVVGDVLAKEIVKTWLESPFEGGRHLERIQSIETVLTKNL